LTTPRDSDKRRSSSSLSLAFSCVISAFALLAPTSTETAVANGDTRTIYLHHAHTGEDIAATYLVNGQYDSRVLEQLNWFLRDWRRDEPTNMDPRLFDVVWEAYRSAGAGNTVINVVSAYRSPETNAMLRARSRAVAKYSQHMLGKAMDTTMPGMPMSQIREIGMKMQRGGVGYYPNANTPFVHLDVGNVRAWPRMSYDQLVRLFPDGKTVHLPTNGQPLPGYEEAKAEIEARGNGAYVTAPRRTFGGFLAALFGGGGEEDDAEVAAPPPSTRKQWSALAPRGGRGEEGGEEGGGDEQPTGRRGRNKLARAEQNLPRGETAMTATGAVAVAPPAPEAAAAPIPPENVAEAPAEEEKRRHYAKVPLPPHRPASLETTEVASLETGAAPEQESGEARHFVNLPLPPRRPARLPNAIADTQDSPKPSHATAETPQGSVNQDDAALAYAPGAPEGAGAEQDAPPRPAAQKAALVPARLDRSNLSNLPAATSTTRAVVGAPITGVRSAARAAASDVLLPPARPRLVGFTSSDAPPAEKFSPGATRTRAAAPKTDGGAKPKQ
jgi:uncharacterized protein YcbK (DUF882 family)